MLLEMRQLSDFLFMGYIFLTHPVIRRIMAIKASIKSRHTASLAYQL